MFEVFTLTATGVNARFFFTGRLDFGNVRDSMAVHEILALVLLMHTLYYRKQHFDFNIYCHGKKSE